LIVTHEVRRQSDGLRVRQRVIMGVNNRFDYLFIVRSAEFEAAMGR
jgi:hypothetical protein